jgi:uncharacterized protein DUF262
MGFMAMTLDSRPGATTREVETLVGMAWAGRIRVPRFQRDFRWNWEDVRRLFDSIVLGYPIGSLLLWERAAPAQTLRLGVLQIDAPEDRNALWVVDGQQRITSLANALHENGQSNTTFALSYDLATEKFVPNRGTSNPMVIPLPVLFDLKKVLRWFADNPMIGDYLDRASGITRSLRQFPVPAYQVSHDDPKVLQDIFDRMNNYGKRLSRAEIFTALNAEDDRDDGNRLTIDLIAQHISTDLNFGVIDGNTVLQAVLARRGTDVKRDVRDEFGENDDEGRHAAFEQGEEALRRAVAFLQHDAGVPHFSMLAYRYLLPPLVRVFALYPEPDARNRRLLRRWFWQAAVAGPQRFKAGTGDAARLLCARVVPDDLTGSVRGLLEVVEQGSPTLPDLRGFATNQAATKIVLCSWWAAGPRNPETGDRYELSELADCLADRGTARDAVRYLVPSRSLPKKFQPWAANRVLMPVLTVDSEEVLQLLVRRPDPNGATWLDVLRSHTLTDLVMDMLRAGALAQALEARQELLTANLRSFLARMCEWEYEDTPPLAELFIDDELADDEDNDADR